MALFTMIMGNGFAAFAVITVGIGYPFLIAQGANPVVVGALGLTAGYCGTLMTPMAANFNIMPAALLETKSKYAIIITSGVNYVSSTHCFNVCISFLGGNEMKLLLTAFDPFGGEKINPALEAVKRVQDKIGDLEIVKLEVPTVFYKSIDTVENAIEKEHPDVVLCIGQAGGRFDLTPERVAININDARIPDNEGNQPLSGSIFEDGENAYFSSLPIKAMVAEIRKADIPASVSNSAGTYVCNHLMYGVLYTIAKKYPSMRGGFMHVPFITSQVANRPTNAPSLSLDTIVKGIEAACKAIAENPEDIVAVEGHTH